MTFRAPVDPDVVTLIADAMTVLDNDPAATTDQIRTREARFHSWMRGDVEPELAHIPTRDAAVAGVRVRWYGDEPQADTDIVVYLHGGGWLAGDVDSYDPDVRRLAAHLGLPVVAIDYRRTPEHPFPAAIDDCIAVLRELQQGAHRSLSLAGDSAGGNLALGTAIAVKAERILSSMLLLYPVVDPTAFDNLSYKDNGADYLLTAEAMREFWDLYVPSDEHRRHPSAAPRFAELEGLPPAVVVSADFDPLRDEDRELAARLIASDVPTTYLPNPGLIHGFQQMVPRIPAATSALKCAYTAFSIAITNASGPPQTAARADTLPLSRKDAAMTPSRIVHFGVGNFHRSHQAKYLHRLHQQGHDLDWTIVGAGLLPGDVRMRDALRVQDYAYTLVERAANGTDEVHRITSISSYFYGPDNPSALIALLADPSTRIVSLTITEGGYNLSDTTGRFDTTNSTMRADTWKNEQPTTVFGYLAAALRRRRHAGLVPFTVMSCDNIQNNGDVAREALASFIEMSDVNLADWVKETTAFPGSMVDRITPVTTEADREWVRATTGYEDPWPVISEDFTQWVIEESFPIGRPRWENAGAQLVGDVAPFETMKLRMLNGSHQALAYVGLLSGYTYVHEAMSDPAVASFVNAFIQEAQRTVPLIKGIDLHEYRTLLLQRFSNPAIQDTLQRLSTDASDRIPKFVVPIAQDLLRQNQPAPATAAVIASWVAAADSSRELAQPLKDRQVGDVKQGLLGERAIAGSFLDRVDWFGALGENPSFRAAYASSLGSLRRDGAPALLTPAIPDH